MAINYQPPSPVSPYTSAAYGAAEEYDKMAPVVQGYRAQQVQAGIAGAQAYNQGIGDVTQRSIAAGQQSAQLEALHQSQQFQQQQEQNAAAQHANMQYAAQEQQAAQQRAQDEQQSRMLQQKYATEFTQAQQLELQHVQQADNWVDQMAATNRVTPEEALEMKAGVRKIRGKLELQKMASETALKQSQAEEQTALAARNTQQTLSIAGLAAKTAPERTVPVYTPDGKVAALIYTDLDGKTHQIKTEATGAEHIAVLEQHESTHYLDAYKKIGDGVRHDIDSAIKDDERNGKEKAGGVREWWSVPGRRQEAMRNALAEAGLPPTLDEYKAQNRARRGQTSALAPPPPPGQGPPPAPAQPPAERPFVPGKPETMSENQKQFVGQLSGVLQQTQKNPDYSAGTKGKVEAAIHSVHADLARYGSFAQMPDAVKPRVKAAMETIDNRDVLDQKPFAKPQEMTPQQRTVVGALDNEATKFEYRQDLPKPTQAKAAEAARGLSGLLAKYGWMKNPVTGQPNPAITPDDRKRLDEFDGFLRTVPPVPNVGPIPKSGNERPPGLQFRATGY